MFEMMMATLDPYQLPTIGLDHFNNFLTVQVTLLIYTASSIKSINLTLKKFFLITPKPDNIL